MKIQEKRDEAYTEGIAEGREEGREEGRAEGQNNLAGVIIQLKAASTESELLKDGVGKSAIDLAKTCI